MNDNSRIEYLRSKGLSHDPFATPVAEQELSRLRDGFYAYFVFPTLPSSKRVNFHELREPQHLFVFGDPGSGKTTLRLSLEADCRTVLDGTLVVSYVIGDDIKKPLTFEEQGIRLAKAFAIDFFVQVVEQFNPLNPRPSKEQIDGLLKQVEQGGDHLRQLIKRILKDPCPDQVLGLSAHWARIGKAPLRYVFPSDELLRLLETCIQSASQPARKGWEAVREGIEISQTWGFKRVLILIDGVDTRLRSIDEMLKLIEPLLEWMPKAEEQDVYLKFFLPREIQEAVSKYLQKEGLSSKGFSSIILTWQPESLQELVRRRFRAANTRYTGLNSLIEGSNDLDEMASRMANNSPRRLLQAISEMIDLQVRRGSHSFKMGG